MGPSTTILIGSEELSSPPPPPPHPAPRSATASRSAPGPAKTRRTRSPMARVGKHCPDSSLRRRKTNPPVASDFDPAKIGRFTTAQNHGGRASWAGPDLWLLLGQKKRVEPSCQADQVPHLADGEERALDVRLRGPSRVVADRQALVRPGEYDFRGHDEARKPDGMHLGAGHCRAARLFRALEVLDGAARLGPPNVTETFGQLARGPARNVRLRGARVVDDLPLREVPSREQRSGLAHRRRQREVAGRDDSEGVLPRGGVDLLEVGVRQTRAPDHDGNA